MTVISRSIGLAFMQNDILIRIARVRWKKTSVLCSVVRI